MAAYLTYGLRQGLRDRADGLRALYKRRGRQKIYLSASPSELVRKPFQGYKGRLPELALVFLSI